MILFILRRMNNSPNFNFRKRLKSTLGSITAGSTLRMRKSKKTNKNMNLSQRIRRMTDSTKIPFKF